MKNPTQASYLNRPELDGSFRCQYTGLPVEFGNHILLPAVIPQVSGNYVCHPDARPAYRAAKAELHKIDRNCNACRHVKRIPHDRLDGGFTEIGCALDKFESKIVHPSDFVGMECWESR